MRSSLENQLMDENTPLSCERSGGVLNRCGIVILLNMLALLSLVPGIVSAAAFDFTPEGLWASLRWFFCSAGLYCLGITFREVMRLKARIDSIEIPPRTHDDNGSSVSDIESRLIGISDTISALQYDINTTSDIAGPGELCDQIDAALEQDDIRTAESLYGKLSKTVSGDSRLAEYREKINSQSIGDADQRFDEFRKWIHDSVSLCRFDDAISLAEELAEQFPDREEATSLVSRVKEEAETFVTSQAETLGTQIQRYAEKRQWKNALECARKLIERYPDSKQAGDVKTKMSAIIDNTRLEEVRELRDRILKLMDRRRYPEAMELSEYVVGNYPETAAAVELRAQMPALRELAANTPG